MRTTSQSKSPLLPVTASICAVVLGHFSKICSCPQALSHIFVCHTSIFPPDGSIGRGSVSVSVSLCTYPKAGISESGWGKDTNWWSSTDKDFLHSAPACTSWSINLRIISQEPLSNSWSEQTLRKRSAMKACSLVCSVAQVTPWLLTSTTACSGIPGLSSHQSHWAAKGAGSP